MAIPSTTASRSLGIRPGLELSRLPPLHAAVACSRLFQALPVVSPQSDYPAPEPGQLSGPAVPGYWHPGGGGQRLERDGGRRFRRLLGDVKWAATRVPASIQKLVVPLALDSARA